MLRRDSARPPPCSCRAMESSGRALRRALAIRERGRGKAVPSELKARVRAHAQERRRQGTTYQQTGAELGLPMWSLRWWSLRASVATMPCALLGTRASRLRMKCVRLRCHDAPAIAAQNVDRLRASTGCDWNGVR